MSSEIVCIPVDANGLVDPRWGRAARVAVAEIRDGQVQSWTEYPVEWDRLHDAGEEGQHHARIARFLIDHKVTRVIAHHMGPGMAHMLDRMGINVSLNAEGNARDALLSHRP